MRTAGAGAVAASAIVAALAGATPASARTPLPWFSTGPTAVHRTAPFGGATVPGTAATLPGTACTAFPADNIWHADITRAPVNARSAQWLSNMQGATRKLHPDFGPSGDPNNPYGIPITVVPSSHALVNVAFDYASESDQVKYPLGADTKIEGGANSGGDMHAIMINASTCELYETWDTRQVAGGSWAAGSGAVWNLASDALRPAGWTSADAAGLPIMPGLLRYDEVLAGNIDHAIRFTTNITSTAYVWPARHEAGSTSDPSYPPMGAWFRLRADYPTAGLLPQTITIIRAMQHHGLILADNGSPWFFQGTADNRWPNALLDQLKQIPASAFQAIDVSYLRVSANSGTAVQVPPARGLTTVVGWCVRPGTQPTRGPCG
jgi:hypothetical protein